MSALVQDGDDPFTEIKSLKEAGNALFKEAKYEEASIKYTQAISVILKNNPSAHAKETSALLSNRSACSLCLNKYPEAEADANNAISMDNTNIKALYRLSKSLLMQGNFSSSLKSIEAGLSLDSENKSLLALKIDCEKNMKSQRKSTFWKQGGASSRYCCDNNQNSICLEKISFCGGCGDSTTSGNSDASPSAVKLSVIFLKETIKSVITNDKTFLASIVRIQTHGFDATFRKLFDKSQFKSLVYPGFPDYVIEKMPNSLKDLLAWRELRLDIFDTANRAMEVLDNVKKKGADRSQVMDSQTESFLLRQITNEQLARDIIQAVRKYSRSLSAIHASLALKLAPSDCEEALRDQLDVDVSETLLKQGIMRQDNFMGDDWTNLISEDIMRFAQDEKMDAMDESNIRGYFINSITESSSATSHISETASSSSSSSSTSTSTVTTSSTAASITKNSGVTMAFLEREMLIDKYPAIHELLNQLHALPYEINNKSESKLQLLEPCKGCTMLLRFPAGAGQFMRWDNREMAEDNQFVSFSDPQSSSIDSLIRLTCSYHLVPAISTSSTSSSATTSDSPSTTTTSFSYVHDASNDSSTSININKVSSTAILNKIENDQLLIHQSTKLQNGRTSATSEYFAVIYYIHGRSWG